MPERGASLLPSSEWALGPSPEGSSGRQMKGPSSHWEVPSSRGAVHCALIAAPRPVKPADINTDSLEP